MSGTKEYTPEDSLKYGDLNRRGALWVDGNLKSSYARILIRKKGVSDGYRNA